MERKLKYEYSFYTNINFKIREKLDNSEINLSLFR